MLYVLKVFLLGRREFLAIFIAALLEKLSSLNCCIPALRRHLKQVFILAVEPAEANTRNTGLLTKYLCKFGYCIKTVVLSSA